ncbi:MAG: YbaK/EbsC family protein [Lachnospiraceae bacterium]|nr:YbaK/EbsC family protein [Lachnospiraceae bacterium]
MSAEKAREHLFQYDMGDRIIEFNESSATVELAAQAIGCEEAMIAKTISFYVDEGAVLIVAAGDTKIDNPKFKAYFGCKAKMIPAAEVEAAVGHAPGGVCPFGVKEGVKVYLDDSLKRFEVVYPAAGSANSAVKMTLEELERASESSSWIDICKYKE